MAEMIRPAQRLGQVTGIGSDGVHTADAGASATAPVVGEEQEAEETGATTHDSNEQEHAQWQQPSVVMVDELAGPEDYWLTLTDAARITRRQEVTIRRWVAAGHLPVRRQPMGLTRRTRHVRASDLARLTPIIDPSAAISDATAHLDLVGIPQQQAQLHAAQHRLTSDIARLIQQASSLAADVHAVREQVRVTAAQHRALEQFAEQLEQRGTIFEAHLAEQRTAIDTGLTALHEQWSALAEESRALAGTVTQLEVRLGEHQQRAATASREQQQLAHEVIALREQLAHQVMQVSAYAEHSATLEIQLAALREQQETHAQHLHQLAATAERVEEEQRRHERALVRLEATLDARLAAHDVAHMALESHVVAAAALAARVAELERRVALLALRRRLHSRAPSITQRGRRPEL